MLKNYGIERFLNKLQKLGLKSINQSADYYGLPLILGGAESSLWEITGMYTQLAKQLKQPFKDNKGSTPMLDLTLVKTKNQVKNTGNLKTQVLSPASIYLMFEAMTGLKRPGLDAGWKAFANSKKIAWKTGTSYGFKDAWSIGITPDYVVGVWIGNADGNGRPELVGVNAAAPLMFSVFENLPSSSAWFDKPIFDMKVTDVCEKSGYIASLNCPNVKTIDIPNVQLKQKPCPFHKIVKITEDKNYQIGLSCNEQLSQITTSWFVLPPIMSYYYRKQHSDYKPLPEFHPSCKSRGFNQLALIYPKLQQDIIIPKTLDGHTSEVVFKAAYAEDKVLYWHLDETFIGSTQYFHDMRFQPEAGEHLLTLVSENGERLQRKFTVSYTD